MKIAFGLEKLFIFIKNTLFHTLKPTVIAFFPIGLRHLKNIGFERIMLLLIPKIVFHAIYSKRLGKGRRTLVPNQDHMVDEPPVRFLECSRYRLFHEMGEH